MNSKKKLLMIVGAFLVISAIGFIAFCIYYVDKSVKPSVGIIGGADRPTVIFLWGEFKGIVLVLAAEFLAGIGCIIAALRRKNGKRNKK